MSQIPFTVSARTAKLIGQENFSNAEGALVVLYGIMKWVDHKKKFA